MSDLHDDLRDLAADPVSYGQETHGELHGEALAHIERCEEAIRKILEGSEPVRQQGLVEAARIYNEARSPDSSVRSRSFPPAPPPDIEMEDATTGRAMLLGIVAVVGGIAAFVGISIAVSVYTRPWMGLVLPVAVVAAVACALLVVSATKEGGW